MNSNEAQKLLELSTRVGFLEEKIMDSLDVVKDTQERMCLDMSKIKEAVYNPDNGLYARLKTLEEESRYRAKFLWLLLSMGIGSIGAAIISHIH